MCIQSPVLAFRHFHLWFRAALPLAAGAGELGGDTASLGRGFLLGGRPSQAPQGFGCGSESDHREVLWPRLGRYLQFRPGRWEPAAFGSGSSKVTVAAPEAAPAALLSVTARDHAHCRPHSPSRTGREMQRRQVVCALQERD